jgi:hypothetical protein
MANGDIQVKVLYRQSLGGGIDANGVAKNTKILVVGEITGTYVAAGLAVNKLGGANAFGVSGLDYIKLNTITIGGVYPTAEKLFKADYNEATHKIFLLEDVGAADPAKPADGDVVVLKFVAVGDDADAPELY